MNINFSWFASVWKSENMVVILLKSMSLSVVNRSQLVRKWTSSSRISHLGHSLSVMGVRGRVYLPLLYGPPRTLFYDSNRAQWDKMCKELISESTGPISTAKKSCESLRTSYMHYGTFYAQAPLGGQNDHGAQYIQRLLDQFTRFKSYRKWCTLTRSFPLDDWKALWKSLSCIYRLASSFPRVSEIS